MSKAERAIVIFLITIIFVAIVATLRTMVVL